MRGFTVQRRLLTKPTLLILLLVGLASVSRAEAAAPNSETIGSAGAPSGAIATVERLQGEFLDVMKNAEALGFEGRYAQLQKIVTDCFDLGFMAEKAVGRHWNKLTPEEQERWLASFHEMTAATYAGRFEGFSGQHFEIDGEEVAKHDTVLVRARLIDPGGEDVQLNYRLHRENEDWRVIDVYLNGTVSELALRRSEFSSVLKRDGFEKLITTIEGKTQEIADASVN